jgi:hypothetical protein
MSHYKHSDFLEFVIKLFQQEDFLINKVAKIDIDSYFAAESLYYSIDAFHNLEIEEIQEIEEIEENNQYTYLWEVSFKSNVSISEEYDNCFGGEINKGEYKAVLYETIQIKIADDFLNKFDIDNIDTIVKSIIENNFSVIKVEVKSFSLQDLCHKQDVIVDNLQDKDDEFNLTEYNWQNRHK